MFSDWVLMSIITQLLAESSAPFLPSRTPLPCAIQREAESPAVCMINAPSGFCALKSCVSAATCTELITACMSLFSAAYRASVRVALSFGMAIAARIPTTAMTNTSSIRLNAREVWGKEVLSKIADALAFEVLEIGRLEIDALDSATLDDSGAGSAKCLKIVAPRARKILHISRLLARVICPSFLRRFWRKVLGCIVWRGGLCIAILL